MLIFLSPSANCSTRSTVINSDAEPLFYDANLDSKVNEKIEKVFSESRRLTRGKAFKKRSLTMRL